MEQRQKNSMETGNSTAARQPFYPNVSRPCEEQWELQSSLAVLYTIIFIPGLIGNLVALWVFLFVNIKKNSVSVFLINIAFADLLLMVCLPFRVLYHSRENRWTLGPTLCSLVGNIFYMNMYISIALLGMISVDRYLKVHQVVGINRRLTTKGSVVVCALTWAAALLVIILVMVFDKLEQPERCFHYRQLLEIKWKAYMNIVIVVAFWVVFITLMTSYVRIGRYLQRRFQERQDSPSALRHKCSAIKSLSIVFLFTLCFVPYHLVRIFYIKTQITETSCFVRSKADRANEIALVFSALNSCLDPLMYFLLSSSMRSELLRLTNRVLSLKDVVTSHGSSSTVGLEHHQSDINLSSV